MNTIKILPETIPKIQVKLLCSTVLEAVQAFYKDPKNQAAFEAWKKGQRDEEHSAKEA